jgi:hypothetical protein
MGSYFGFSGEIENVVLVCFKKKWQKCKYFKGLFFNFTCGTFERIVGCSFLPFLLIKTKKTGAQTFCCWTRYLVHARGEGGIDEFDLVHQRTYLISLLDLVD